MPLGTVPIKLALIMDRRKITNNSFSEDIVEMPVGKVELTIQKCSYLTSSYAGRDDLDGNSIVIYWVTHTEVDIEE